ncbi:MAG: gliding motility-associated C-terminal domain-containing protein [Marinilabiliaceae bacterium]
MTRNRIAAIVIALTAVGASSVAQVQYDGYALKANVDGETVYLYTDGTTPRISVSLAEAADIEWLHSFDGQTNDTIHQTTAASDEISVTSEGLYTVVVGGQDRGRSWWLSPHPGMVSFTVDSADCEALYAKAKSEAPDVSFGGHTLRQEITYQWERGDEALLTTRDTIAELTDIYGEGPLTLRAVNQAFNEIAVTDSVWPIALKAAYEIESRKETADNEATETGEAMSAPADVSFKNNSEGRYTVCEWEIGKTARLYDREPVYQFQKPDTYTITLTITNEETGCASSDSSMTVTITDAALEFPNAFTPNGDGTNDIFLPSFRSLRKYELTIYNRWGKRVFTSNDPTKGWDGNEHGREAAAGTYYYVSTAEGYEKGVSFKRKGSVTLVR